jgi:hypothetical protein
VVGNSEDEDSIRLDPVDEIVREPAYATFPRIALSSGSRPRMCSDLLESSLDPVEEDFTEAGDFPLVEVGALEKLSPRYRMPGDPSHFSRERASRRTSSEGRDVTSPLSISR